jgi:RNA polymerase sigma-70 factor (ECF subfamily)
MADEKMDDMNIVEEVLRGNRQAFTQLVERYTPGSRYYFWCRCGGKTDMVQDLLQEAFLRAFRSLRTLVPGTSFRKWFRTICHHLLIDFQRKAVPGRLAEDTPAPREAGKLDQILEKRVLHQALDKLPDKQKEVIELKYLWDFTVDEIAGALEMPVGTVKSHLSSGKKRLAELLETREVSA